MTTQSMDPIGIPLREALKLGPLSEAVVVGGKAGLDRLVTTVTVMETDDAFRFLTGNELLITAFYAVRDDLSAQLRWIDELANRGCAGVILCYIGRYFKGDLNDLIQRTDELAFPLITIPDSQVIYSDIITAVLTELLHRQTNRLEYALLVHERLTHEALMGAPLETLIESLSELLQSTVVMTDMELKVIASSPFGPQGQKLLAHLLSDTNCLQSRAYSSPVSALNEAHIIEQFKQKGKDICESSLDVAVQPVQVGHTLDGYLLVFKHGEAITKIQDYALQVGVTVIALERMGAMRVRETERRLQGDFLDDLLNWTIKSPETIAKQAQSLGLDLENKRAVMVISMDNFDAEDTGSEINTATERLREDICQVVESVVQAEFRHHIVAPRGSRILVLIGIEPNSISSTQIKDQLIKLGENIRGKVKSHRLKNRQFSNYQTVQSSSGPMEHLSQIEVSIGISEVSPNYTSLRQGYIDALQALEIGQRMLGAGHVVHFDDTSLYAVLDFVSERKEAHQMIEDVLGPIKAYDSANGTDLLKTLEMLCLSGECNTEVAQKLYIHRNTLTYRQARIKELVGFDPFSGQGRIRMDIALMLDKLNKSTQTSRSMTGDSSRK